MTGESNNNTLTYPSSSARYSSEQAPAPHCHLCLSPSGFARPRRKCAPLSCRRANRCRASNGMAAFWVYSAGAFWCGFGRALPCARCTRDCRRRRYRLSDCSCEDSCRHRRNQCNSASGVDAHISAIPSTPGTYPSGVYARISPIPHTPGTDASGDYARISAIPQRGQKKEMRSG